MGKCRICLRVFPRPLEPGLSDTRPASADSSVCYRCWKVGTALVSPLDVPLPPGEAVLPDILKTVPQEIDVTPQGGKHSAIGKAFHHFDPSLMLNLAEVLHQGGARYGRDNWKRISSEDHLNHALNHVFVFMATQDLEEVEHAILRLMFAWVTTREGNYGASN